MSMLYRMVECKELNRFGGIGPAARSMVLARTSLQGKVKLSKNELGDKFSQ